MRLESSHTDAHEFIQMYFAGCILQRPELIPEQKCTD